MSCEDEAGTSGECVQLRRVMWCKDLKGFDEKQKKIGGCADLQLDLIYRELHQDAKGCNEHFTGLLLLLN